MRCSGRLHVEQGRPIALDGLFEAGFEVRRILDLDREKIECFGDARKVCRLVFGKLSASWADEIIHIAEAGVVQNNVRYWDSRDRPAVALRTLPGTAGRSQPRESSVLPRKRRGEPRPAGDRLARFAAVKMHLTQVTAIRGRPESVGP